VVAVRATPAVANPTIVQDAKRGAGFWAIAGSLTASETIYNIGVTGYPKDASGLVFRQATAIHLETLAAGTSWQWQTSSYEGARPASFLLAVSY